jgi:hypothetical protein
MNLTWVEMRAGEFLHEDFTNGKTDDDDDDESRNG